jgi:hypothetical protein
MGVTRLLIADWRLLIAVEAGVSPAKHQTHFAAGTAATTGKPAG